MFYSNRLYVQKKLKSVALELRSLTAIWSCLLFRASARVSTAFPAPPAFRFPSDSNKHEFCCLAFQHKNRQSCWCSCGRRAINMYLLLGTLYHFTPLHSLAGKWNFTPWQVAYIFVSICLFSLPFVLPVAVISLLFVFATCCYICCFWTKTLHVAILFSAWAFGTVTVSVTLGHAQRPSSRRTILVAFRAKWFMTGCTAYTWYSLCHCMQNAFSQIFKWPEKKEGMQRSQQKWVARNGTRSS